MGEGFLIKFGSLFPSVHSFDGIFPFNVPYINSDNIINSARENEEAENLIGHFENGHYRVYRNRKELD
ncbi:MAG: hypothetical protein WC584_03690 [Candidatus Pacearchaeota archaeon]